MAAIFYLQYTLMLNCVPTGTWVLPDPENKSIAVGSLLPYCIRADIYVISYLLPDGAVCCVSPHDSKVLQLGVLENSENSISEIHLRYTGRYLEFSTAGFFHFGCTVLMLVPLKYLTPKTYVWLFELHLLFAVWEMR